MQLNCDEVVSLIQKLCENIGAMNLQHDKASVTWIGTFLQRRAKELEDKVAGLWLGHLGPGAARGPQARRKDRGPAAPAENALPPQTPDCREEEEVEFQNEEETCGRFTWTVD